MTIKISTMRETIKKPEPLIIGNDKFSGNNVELVLEGHDGFNEYGFTTVISKKDGSKKTSKKLIRSVNPSPDLFVFSD